MSFEFDETPRKDKPEKFSMEEYLERRAEQMTPEEVAKYEAQAVEILREIEAEDTPGRTRFVDLDAEAEAGDASTLAEIDAEPSAPSLSRERDYDERLQDQEATTSDNSEPSARDIPAEITTEYPEQDTPNEGTKDEEQLQQQFIEDLAGLLALREQLLKAAEIWDEEAQREEQTGTKITLNPNPDREDDAQALERTEGKLRCVAT